MELERKLGARGFESDLIAEVLDALERERLLSTHRFAEQFVHQRSARGHGPLKILHELRQRGVDEAIASEFVEPSDPAWTTSARRALCKRFGERPPAGFRDRAKQSRFLEQRGFSREQIRRALEADDSNDHENQ